MAKINYYGKYRAKVQNVNDPEKRGRIRVLCPKVLGESVSNWCEPCVPVAYNFGGDFAIPKVGETVWVEFEAGDVNKPIYTGGWWSTNSTPSNPYDVGTRLITWGNCKISISDNEVSITAPSVKVNGSEVARKGDTVTVNTETGKGYIG